MMVQDQSEASTSSSSTALTTGSASAISDQTPKPTDWSPAKGSAVIAFSSIMPSYERCAAMRPRG